MGQEIVFRQMEKALKKAWGKEKPRDYINALLFNDFYGGTIWEAYEEDGRRYFNKFGNGKVALTPYGKISNLD